MLFKLLLPALLVAGMWGYIPVMEKKILDVCCSGRAFWFDKHHPNALYVDKRISTLCSFKGSTIIL